VRIELDHTPEDWRAFGRFHLQRVRRGSAYWIFLIGAFLLVLLAIVLAQAMSGRSASWSLSGLIALVAGWIALVRVVRARAVIPESFLGPQVYELRDDGIATTTHTGTALVEWRAVREVNETAEHLFARLDSVTCLVLPKRDLAAHGGAAAVRAEIERRIAIARGAEAVPRVAPEANLSTSAAEAAHPGGPSLLRNLLAGLRLLAFLPVERRHFAPSPSQAVLLAAVALGVWIGLDRLQVEGAAEIDWFTVQQVVAVGALAIALLVLLAPGSVRGSEWLTAIAATSPCLVGLWIALQYAADSDSDSRLRFAPWLVPVMAATALYRAQKLAAHPRPGAALRAACAVAAISWLFVAVLDGPVEFWFEPDAESASEAAAESPENTERDLFRQADLVDAAVAQVSPGTPGVTESYFVGFAGDGRQHVFDKEVRFAQKALATRIDLAHRAVLLINAPEPDARTPLATASGLRRALAGIARRMNLDEDVLVLFLTSHGSEDAELTVAQGELPLEGLRGDDLRSALDEAGIRWRIVVISACHSASFIPYLEDPRTLVATASRADRTSMGCSEDRELTYFGEALFRDALPEARDWLSALARAREVVERHEREENIADAERSEPQVFVGARMRAKLAELAFRPANYAP
jgi:hypothetical protein